MSRATVRPGRLARTGLSCLAFAVLSLAAACSSSTLGRGSSSATSAAPAGHGLVVAVGPARTLPSRFFGFNAESIVLPVDTRLFMSPKLHAKLAAFPAGILRIPGGTTSQWLDWRTGTFITGPGSPFTDVGTNRPSITMARWASILRSTHTTPLWDLNVTNATLDDQLDMLRAAAAAGLPVTRVELGNEIWNPAGPYTKLYPTGAAYGRAMNSWIAAIKQAFPGVQVAVSGADEANTTFRALGARYTQWNVNVLSAVHGEDAIAIHPYWTLPGLASPGSSVVATLAAGQQHWQAFARTLATLPKGIHVWLTEWNQIAIGSNGGTQIWAQALSVAQVALDQATDPAVTVSLLHDIVGGAKNPQDAGAATVFPLFTDGASGSPKLARTALGTVIPLLYRTVTAGATVRSLTVTGAPQVAGSAGVTGVLVHGAVRSALLVNRTARPVSVDLSASLGKTLSVTARYAPPSSQPGWVATDTVTSVTPSSRDGSVTLPPYSVVRAVAGVA